MTAALHATKLNRRFDLLDADSDGYLEREDFEALAHRLVQGFTCASDSPQAQAVVKTYLEFWEGFIKPMDADGDGKVSREEFVSTVTGRVRAGDSFDRTYRPHMEAVVNLADADGDGVLSRGEFIRLGALAGVSEEQSNRSFLQIDTDGNGSLTAQELVAAAREFYLSDDPDAVGNHLFGQL